MDNKLRNLNLHNILMDEIWGFVGKKQRHIKKEDDPDSVGDMWTFCSGPQKLDSMLNRN